MSSCLMDRNTKRNFHFRVAPVSTIGAPASDPNCILVEDAHVTSNDDRPLLKGNARA